MLCHVGAVLTGEGEVEEEDGDDEGSDSSEEEDVDMEEVEEEIPSQGLSSLLTEDATGQVTYPGISPTLVCFLQVKYL